MTEAEIERLKDRAVDLIEENKLLKAQIERAKVAIEKQTPKEPKLKAMKAPFRPCEADGKPAIFHRWVQEDKALLQLEAMMTYEHLKIIKRDFDLHGFAPANAQIEKISQTFALVEYKDGTVGKVEPEKIKFTDREGGQ